MIRVALCTTNPALAQRLREAIGDSFLQVGPATLPADAHGFATLVGGPDAVDIAVLDTAGTSDDLALGLAADLTARTAVSVILVAPSAHRLALGALRAGVRDVLPATAPPPELREALDRIARLREHRVPATAPAPGPDQRVGGRVITVTSPKGGVGKTTVATNLAVGLAQRAPQQVVLVDADLHFGDVASALNLSPQHTLPEIALGPAAGDTIAVKSFLARHATGLYVVAGSDSPAAADAVGPADLSRLVELLRGQFAHIVIDTAPGLGDHTLAALDRTDDLVLVTSLDVPGVRGLRKEIDTLADLDMVVGSRHIVVNFDDASRGMSIADVEATIRTKVDVVLPQSKAVPLSTNQGIPLLQGGGRDKVTRELRSLLDVFAPAPASPRRALFARSSQ